MVTDHYSVAGMNFAVRSTNVGFLELVRGYLGPFRVDGGAEDVLYSADSGQEKALPGGKTVHAISRLYLGGLRIFYGLDKDQMAGRLIGSIRDKITSYEDQYVRLRTGAVTLDEGALIMPSPAEPRLPALVAMLTRSGARYLGDELVHIDPVLRQAHGVSSPPLPLLINEPELPFFPELRREPARRRRREREEASTVTRRPVVLKELNAEPAEPAPVRWIAFPYFVPGAITEFQPVARSEALFRFSQALLNFNIWGDRAFILLREMLESASVARLIVGSLPDAAELLRSGNPTLLAG